MLITTVAGNVTIDATTENTLKLLEFFDKKIPVAKGSAKPLLEPLVDASNIHGNSGMDGYNFAYPTLSLQPNHAVICMRDSILFSKEPVTIIAIGPLTNIALLFSMFPEVKNNIDEIVIMGGSMTRGNRTPMGEFNIVTDPEAAKIVFHFGLPLVMCGLDIGWKALLYKDDIQEIKNMNKTGNMLYSLFKHYRGGSLETGLKMYDSCALLYLLQPDLYTYGNYFVDIEVSSTLTKGCTIVDLKHYLKQPPNVKVCLELDTEKFRIWIKDALSLCI